MSKRKKQTQVINSLLLILLILGSSYLASSNFLADNHPLKELYHHLVGDSDSSQRRITSSHPSRPSEALASSVLTNQVKDQLGSSIEWNGAGAFVINQNKTTLNAKVSSLPYAQNETKVVQGQEVAWRANALLSKETRQYQKRHQDSTPYRYFKPAGWHQLHGLKGEYDHAVDRGHLLGYAIVGGLKSFDASMTNSANIATQLAWANQADEVDSTGQNYYEGQIRRALDAHKRVRYSVTLIYEGKNLVASGSHLEAKSADGSLEFNVFIPNVQKGLVVDYYSGKIRLGEPQPAE